VHAVFLEAHIERHTPGLPAVCLIVSGGHTLLYYVEAKPGAGSTLSPSEKVRLYFDRWKKCGLYFYG